ncbi:MAG: hypothetical protein RIR28_1248 [Pseudomonadota bacterium]|jgi:hypothetical protein
MHDDQPSRPRKPLLLVMSVVFLASLVAAIVLRAD